MLIQDLKDPKSISNFKKNPKDLTADEAKSEFNNSIPAAIVRQYIERESTKDILEH